MRSPVGIALLFSLLLLGWLFSRPIQELLAGHEPPATPAPVASTGPVPPQMTVRVVESVARPIAPEIVVNGHTEAVRTVQLKAETDGRVVETPAVEGSLVEAGALIASLDLRDRQSRVSEMQAAVAQRELEYDAARKLGAKKFQSETQVAQALTQLEAARAALHQAKLDLEHVTIEAPFKGVVERRMVEAGDYVEPGDPVAEVIEQDPFLVVGDAPETIVARFAVGEPGAAMLADGRTMVGRIRYVASRADADTRTFRVELEVPNPERPPARRHERAHRGPRAGDRGASRLGGDPGPGRRRHHRHQGGRSEGHRPLLPGQDRQGRDRCGLARRPARAAAGDHHRPGLRRRRREGRRRDRARGTCGRRGNGESADMNRLIAACFDRSRVVVVGLLLIVLWGAVVAYEIPKEADPDVQLPIIYVSLSHEGISPEDAERLLVRPMERELQVLEGLKEMRSTSSQGHASVLLEFEAGVDIDLALIDVREKVDRAKAELPDETDEPIVEEVNLSLFPVLVVTLAGPVPERTLLTLARDLQDRLEALPDVLEVEIGGDREEVVEIVIDPLRIEAYDLQLETILGLVQRNNQLVAAGSWDVGQGRFAVKVPGLIEDLEDMLRMPIKVAADRVVTLGDVAEVRRTFKDPEGFARVDGRSALALEVKKRIGRNIIETIEQVRARGRGRAGALAGHARGRLPAGQVRATSAPCWTISATTC